MERDETHDDGRIDDEHTAAGDRTHTEHTGTDTAVDTDGTAALRAAARDAVDLLAGAIEDVYRRGDVEEAEDRLTTAVADAPDTTTTARVRRALEYLDNRPTDSRVDERRLEVRNALAELAPVAADRVAGTDDVLTPRPRAERVAVPVFYTIPEIVAERALARFRERLDAHRGGDVERGHACLREYVYDEINEQPVLYVGGTPLGEYASGRVPVLHTADLEPTEEDPDDVE